MPDDKPAARLAAIVAHLEPLLTDPTLTSQQQTFIQHMHRTAHTLHDTARQIPATAVALRQILPVLGDDFLHPQQVLVGYAKMLIDHPESFDGATLSMSQRQALMQVHDESVSLYRFTERLRDEAFTERREQRNASPVDFELNMLIWQHVPVYRYWLSDEAVTLTVGFSGRIAPGSRTALSHRGTCAASGGDNGTRPHRIRQHRPLGGASAGYSACQSASVLYGRAASAG